MVTYELENILLKYFKDINSPTNSNQSTFVECTVSYALWEEEGSDFQYKFTRIT